MKVPGHIAIIMDGNGRWAKTRNLPRIVGHSNGIKTVDFVTEECARLGVKALTLYTFSSENWKRPKEEVTALMGMLKSSLIKYGQKLCGNNIKFNTIGKLHDLPCDLLEAISELKEKTRMNSGMVLTLALNYGGRQEILEAVKAVCREFGKSQKNIESLGEDDFGRFLFTEGLPQLDLVIRTSGEKRLSNFLLWQSAYSEFYFTDVLWPDFRAEELRKALDEYAKRARRFGG